jgi:hypothetical protein
MGAVFGSYNALCGPTNRHTVALKYSLVRENSFESGPSRSTSSSKVLSPLARGSSRRVTRRSTTRLSTCAAVRTALWPARLPKRFRHARSGRNGGRSCHLGLSRQPRCISTRLSSPADRLVTNVLVTWRQLLLRSIGGGAVQPHHRNEKTLAGPRPPPSTSYVEALSKVYGSRGAHSSRKVLSLFSGPYERDDGLAAYLNAVGISTVQVDNDRRWGDVKHDILRDDFFQSLIRRVAMGEFLCIMAAPPCSTFSISRFFHSGDSKDGGPPPVRTRAQIMGVHNIPAGPRSYVACASSSTLRVVLVRSL